MLCVCIHVCEDTWRPEVGVRNHPPFHFHLFFEEGSLSQIQSSLSVANLGSPLTLKIPALLSKAGRASKSPQPWAFTISVTSGVLHSALSREPALFSPACMLPDPVGLELQL